MKIMFWIRPHAALIVILAVNIFVPALNAENRQSSIERKTESSRTYDQVFNVLADNGLEKDIAEEKLQVLFGVERANVDVQIQNLLGHPVLEIQHEALIKTLAKRALYGRNINLQDYHSLTGLVHDLKGHALCEAERNGLFEVSALNRTL